MKPMKRNELKEGFLYLLFTGAILAVVVAFLFWILWLTMRLAILIGIPKWSGAAVLAVLLLWSAVTNREG